MASQKYYVFSVMHVRRSTYTEYIRGSLLRVVQCALAFRCKATDICAREPLLDAVETSALYGAGCRRRRHRHRAPRRRVAPPPAPRAVASRRHPAVVAHIADTVGCRLLCGMRAPLATPLFLLLHFENVENVVRHVLTASRTRLKKEDECKRVEKQKKI